MSWHYLEKEFQDYADTIEGVNIHYIWTPADGAPDWEHQRVTRFMPVVHSTLPEGHVAAPAPAPPGVQQPRVRKKILKLPLRILDPRSGTLIDRYLLHHYFEVFQDGYRHFSPLYTEEVSTGAGADPELHETAEMRDSPPAPFPQAYIRVKESKE